MGGLHFTVFLPQVFAQFFVQFHGVYQLHFAFALGFFSVAHNPDVGRNTRVVENIFGQSDDTFQPIVFNDVFAYFAFATASVAREQGRTVVDGRNAAAEVGVVFHFAHHVHQKQQLPVRNRRQANLKTLVFDVLTSLFSSVAHNGLFVNFPSFTIRRIGEHKIKTQMRKTIFTKRGAIGNVLRLFAFYEHITGANSVSFGIYLLPIKHKICFAVRDFQRKVFGFGKHTATTAGRVVNQISAFRYFVFHGREQNMGHQLNNFARGEVFARFFVVFFVKLPNQFFKHIPHSQVGERRQGFAFAVFGFVGAKVNFFVTQFFNEQIGNACLFHGFQLIPQFKLADNFLHVWAVTVQIDFQIGVNVIGIVHQGFKREFGNIPKRIT